MKISPEIFFSHIMRSLSSSECRIVIDGDWCYLRIDEANNYNSPQDNSFRAVIRGELFDLKDSSNVSARKTVAKIGDKNIPCEITSCNVEVDFRRIHGLDGQFEDMCVGRRTFVDVLFEYSDYEKKYGDLEDTIEGIPESLQRIVAVTDGIVKKTIFNILDLD